MVLIYTYTVKEKGLHAGIERKRVKHDFYCLNLLLEQAFLYNDKNQSPSRLQHSEYFNIHHVLFTERRNLSAKH